MKLLRETITRLLVENQSHYDKLIALLVSSDIESIVQGIDLADTLGYFEEVHHKEYEMKYSGSKQEWLIFPIPAFLDRFKQLHPNGVSHEQYESQAYHIHGYVDLGDASISIGWYI